MFFGRQRLSTGRPRNLVLLLMIRFLPPHVFIHLSQRSNRIGRHVTHYIAQHSIAVMPSMLACGRPAIVEEGRCSRFELPHIVDQLILQAVIEVLLRLRRLRRSELAEGLAHRAGLRRWGHPHRRVNVPLAAPRQLISEDLILIAVTGVTKLL